MSLIVKATSGSTIEPISEGSHLAVCHMIVDLGMQYAEAFKKSSRKVIIGWEIPGETIQLEDGPHPRTIYNTYNSTITEGTYLRRDLAAWRGRDFTAEELEGFELRNVLGTSCLINIIHNEKNGKTYSNIQSIMALPRGMEKGRLSEPPVLFDLDTSNLSELEKLPKWIAELVKKSETYQDRLASPVTLTEVQDDGELPF